MLFVKVNIPDVVVEETAEDKSVHVVLSMDPCNLKVFPATFDKAQVDKSRLSPEIGIGFKAFSLKISLLTHETDGAKAEDVAEFPSIEFPIT
jgi:hypothetical protein